MFDPVPGADGSYVMVIYSDCPTGNPCTRSQVLGVARVGQIVVQVELRAGGVVSLEDAAVLTGRALERATSGG